MHLDEACFPLLDTALVYCFLNPRLLLATVSFTVACVLLFDVLPVNKCGVVGQARLNSPGREEKLGNRKTKDDIGYIHHRASKMVHGSNASSRHTCFIYVLLLLSLVSSSVKANPSKDAGDRSTAVSAALARRFLEILEQPLRFRDEEEEFNCKVLIR
jgi:hypothetical protein